MSAVRKLMNATLLCFQLVDKLTTDEDIQDVEFDCDNVSPFFH